MESLHHISGLLALTMGAAWACGINLYAAIVVLGGLGFTGNITLPQDLQILSHPLVLGAAGLMYLVEFFADKIPGVDTLWDSIHTLIRIPGGALLAAGAAGEINPAITLAAAIVGGALSAGSHAAKAGTRVMINTSPEPFSNSAASITEDAAVVGGLWTAINHPILFLCLLVVFIALLIWLLPKLWRGIRKVFGFAGRLFSKKAVLPEN